MAKEYILWGKPKGKAGDLDSLVLYSQGKSEADIERIKVRAAADGFHSFRVQVIDLSKPFDASAAFTKAIK